MKEKLLGNRKLLVWTAVILGALLLSGVIVLTMHQSSIEQTKTEITLEAGEELQVSAEDFFKTAESNYRRIRLDSSAVDTANVGEYEIKAAFRDKEFVIKVKVVDTKAPEVTLRERHVYMSDLTKPVDIEFEYYDATKVEMSLAGAEKIQELEGVTEEKVKILTDIIEVPCDQEKLGKITSITEEEGILRGVLKFEDAYGNFFLEEIVIVYDKPDGEAAPEDANESDEKEDGKTEDKKTPPNQTENNTSTNTGNTGNSEGSGGTTNPSTPSKPSESSKPSEPSKPEEPSTPSAPEIEEPETSLTPGQQAAVNAGYYNVVPTPSGGYVVMVKVGESNKGHALIDDYLDSIGMERTGGYGCLIGDERNNQYMCGVGANEYREKTHADDPSHPDFWN